MANILYVPPQNHISSTQRLSRVILYFAIIFFDVVPKQKKSFENRTKFLMGSLYALGGLMRIEAKNYLETKKKYDPNFRIVGKLF
jgi:hypothetical protein